MNIQPIKMGTWEARKKALEYGQRVREDKESRFAGEGQLRRRVRRPDRKDQEDIALHKAYCALARGEQVISLPSAFRNAGLDPNTQLPRLAIVRADAERVSMRFDSSKLLFVDSNDHWRAEPHARVAVSLLPAELTDRAWRKNNGHSIVENVFALAPQIPPAHRPKCLRERYLLWEPKWQPIPPDPDPFLLKPLGGGFFVVEAKWDMTPLEQALLEGRL
jgi:hypothetical protein